MVEQGIRSTTSWDGKRLKSPQGNLETRPGADYGNDHQLLIAIVQLRLKAKKAIAPPTRYDVDNIPGPIQVLVKNTFLQLLQIDEEEQTPIELWEDIKDIVQTDS